jgi:archaemetzincin
LDKQSILLISHGHFEQYCIETIANDICSEFLLPVNIEADHSDLSEFYDPTRRQYDGNKLLKSLNSRYQSDSLKVIGLFRVDLFIPILTYIFGQAIFKGRTGIASIYRLKNEQYGMNKDEFLLLERFRKVVIHELGHTFGLVHCYVPSCVMRSSTYVEDIDQKKQNLCSKCRDQINASSL